MILFILYQTDQWKSKSSRVFFGVFDNRSKAIDCAKYNRLETDNMKIIIVAVTLNICEKCE